MHLSPLSTTGRAVAVVFTVLMGAMAWLQLNDPDPLLWCTVYACLALLCLLGVLKGTNKYLVWMGLGIAFIWAATLSPSVYELFRYHSAGDLLTGMSPDRPYVEEARESLGLIIGCIAMACLLGFTRREAESNAG